MQLGNSEAVKAGNAREARTGDKMREPTKRSPAKSPARETAEKRAAATPEREPERKPAPRKLSHYEEWEGDLRRAIPGITDEAIQALKVQYYQEP